MSNYSKQSQKTNMNIHEQEATTEEDRLWNLHISEAEISDQEEAFSEDGDQETTKTAKFSLSVKARIPIPKRFQPVVSNVLVTLKNIFPQENSRSVGKADVMQPPRTTTTRKIRSNLSKRTKNLNSNLVQSNQSRLTTRYQRKQHFEAFKSGVFSPLLTDLYQLTMAYSNFTQHRENDVAVFDVFFRENPFKGKYTIFAGLNDVLHFLKGFEFQAQEVKYLCQQMDIPGKDVDAFSKYLLNLKHSVKNDLKVYAIEEGSIVFPRVPVITLEGPLGLLQILETPILNLTGYASLITTNAARMKKVVGENINLLEFGLRRAQGPDGGMRASKFAIVGGFSGTSNCLAGYIYDIMISGTLAHSFISSFTLDSVLPEREIIINDRPIDFVEVVDNVRSLFKRKGFAIYSNTNTGELKALTAYALSFPRKFLALVDTYSTINSGVPNFLIVAFALMLLNLKPVGVRLDSGDLGALSNEARKMFKNMKKDWKIAFEDSDFLTFQADLTEKALIHAPLSAESTKKQIDAYIDQLIIVASNDLDEEALRMLVNSTTGCEINAFGIGTHLVTCKSQPALGMVYKLASVGEKPRIKLSDDLFKQTFPGFKQAFRLFDERDVAICDVLQMKDEVNGLQNHLSRSHRGQQQMIFMDISGNENKITFSYCQKLHNLINLKNAKTDKAAIDMARKAVMESLFNKGKFKFQETLFQDKEDYQMFLSEQLYDESQSLREKESGLLRELSEVVIVPSENEV